MAGRAAVLSVLLLLATFTWANPINRDDFESTSTDAPQSPQPSVAAVEEKAVESPATELPESSNQESVAPAVEEKPTAVEKADAVVASDKVQEPSEPVVEEEQECTSPEPTDVAPAVEKASSPEVAEEATTVAPAAEDVIIAERVPSEQESDVPEATERSEVEADSVTEEEPEVARSETSVVEESSDGEEEQSSVTEASPAEVVEEKIAVEKVSEVEEEIAVTESEVEVTTAVAEEDQEAVERARMGEDVIEVTTQLDDANEREDATENPIDRTAEESSNVEVVTAVAVESEDESFRQGEVDITEAPEEEDISSTTAIPQSEAEIRGEDDVTDEPSTDSPIDRVDSATDIVYVEEKTEVPEELIPAESIVREETVEPEVVTEEAEDEIKERSSLDLQEESQDVTTEGYVPEVTEISSSQTFDDAAPIRVVEIKVSNKPAESIVPEDSAPIEIVEITEASQPLVEGSENVAPAADERESSLSESEAPQTTEIVPDQRDEATTISAESPVTRDEQEVPSGDEQDQELENTEEKPNDSKIQPVQISEDYWRTMVSEENPSTQPSVVPTEASEIAKDQPTEVVEEVEAVEVSLRDDESAPTVEAAQTASVNDQIAKVAQKYGLQSVGSVFAQEKPVEEVVSDSEVASNVDVPKEESLYLGSESKRTDFQGSNDITRRLSFGDKVVRFVRSYL